MSAVKNCEKHRVFIPQKVKLTIYKSWGFWKNAKEHFRDSYIRMFRREFQVIKPFKNLIFQCNIHELHKHSRYQF